MGMETDLRLVDDQYEWLGSIFYFGRSHLVSDKDLSNDNG